MIPPTEHPPYITVMRGVGVYFAAYMVWHEREDSYRLERTGKARKTLLKAEGDAFIMAAGSVEIRQLSKTLRED